MSRCSMKHNESQIKVEEDDEKEYHFLLNWKIFRL